LPQKGGLAPAVQMCILPYQVRHSAIPQSIRDTGKQSAGAARRKHFGG